MAAVVMRVPGDRSPFGGYADGLVHPVPNCTEKLWFCFIVYSFDSLNIDDPPQVDGEEGREAAFPLSETIELIVMIRWCMLLVFNIARSSNKVVAC